MAVEVYMPKLGMTMQEGLIVCWLKEEGETVNNGEAIVEISSEKITNVVEATTDGVMGKILYTEGEVVKVGAIIAYIVEEGDEMVGIEAKVVSGRVISDGGVINKEEPEYDINPLSPLRKAIGERMAESLRRSPQGTMTTRADMLKLIAFKNKLSDQGEKVSFTDLFVKIASIALLSNPQINSSVRDGMVYTFKSTHIGVAVGGDNALLVPVIKNVERKSVLEVSQEMKVLSQKVKENKISMDEMSGGTFTVSNLGMFDVDVITPIINPPESCILAIGTTRQEVVVTNEGQTTIKPMVTLSLTADHTIVDGIPAVKFLTTFKEIMNHPEKYLE
ncbi:MAG: dihydrolipoamide acetyltransferase family protein [Peptococcales bacterium]